MAEAVTKVTRRKTLTRLALRGKMPPMTSPHPTPPADTIGLVEVRAWARASARIARDEGFDRTAAAVEAWVTYLDDLQAAGVHSLRLSPA